MSIASQGWAAELDSPAPRQSAAGAAPSAPLIMDVGMHWGKDTRYYLAKGFRVVAIEARPDFVQANQRRFAREIQSGRLTIVPCAVAESDGVTPFWIFPGKDEWGTLDPRYAQRNIARGCDHRVVEVPCRRFARILAEHGIPYYLKVDIEGADLLCVRALAQFSGRPQYVSLELTMVGFEAAFEALAQLYALGYRRFKIVNQALNPIRRCPLPAREGEYAPTDFDTEMSGPFGEEAPGAWRDAAGTLQRIRHLLKMEKLFSPEGPCGRWGWMYNGAARLREQRRSLRHWRAALTTASWYDLHAAGPRAR